MEAPPETGDPVADLILSGRASSVREAENIYLDEHLDDVLALCDSHLSDQEFREHPLIVLLMSHGSRPSEDSLR
jgi:hypothetical protein